jgi:hypothetical protein
VSRPNIHAAYVDKPATTLYRLDGDSLEPVGLVITSGTTSGGALTYDSLADVFSGALLTLNVDHNIPVITGTHDHLIEWENVEYEVGSWVETTASGLQFQVPEGVGYVMLRFNALWDSSAGSDRGLSILKNGLAHPGMGAIHADGASDLIQMAHSAPLPVTAGDRFEARVEFHGGQDKDIIADPQTWFSIERVG